MGAGSHDHEQLQGEGGSDGGGAKPGSRAKRPPWRVDYADPARCGIVPPSDDEDEIEEDADVEWGPGDAEAA